MKGEELDTTGEGWAEEEEAFLRRMKVLALSMVDGWGGSGQLEWSDRPDKDAPRVVG